MQAFKPVSALVLALSLSLYAGAAPAAAAGNSSNYGGIVHNTSAVRTIVVKPDTKWVNVTNGEAVTFIVGEKRFT